MANIARVTQSVIEAVTTANGTAQVTQSVIELVVVLGITCNSPPQGTVGTAYNHSFLAGGGQTPYTFTLTAGALPPGLGMDGTGLVTGTPTVVGMYVFTVTVTDANMSTASVNCSITIIGVAATRLGKASGAGAPKFCPEIKRNLDWSTFQREYESFRPLDVEEVRVPCKPRRW
jgi:Putative Ig domain